MNEKEMWKAFCESAGIPEDTEYEAWAFGDDSDKLAELVKDGIKTGTSSAYEIYEIEGEPIPQEGEYNAILDSKDQAVCVTKTLRVYVVPFCKVDARHARLEGEGDLSLEYWRKVHEAFFTNVLADFGLSFNETMPVVCEEFELVYPTVADRCQ